MPLDYPWLYGTVRARFASDAALKPSCPSPVPDARG